MPRLPHPGSDQGTWGQILNDYLSAIHSADGTLKDNVITSSSLASDAVDASVIVNNSITEAKLDSTIQAKLNAGSGGTINDATSSTKGIIQLAGDLGGTAVAPTVPGLAGKANTSHTHTASQLSDSTATGRSVLTAVDSSAARTAIGAGTSSLTLGTTGTTAKAGDYVPTWTEVTSKPSTFAPSAHTHAIADTTGLQTVLDSKASQSTTYTKTEVDSSLSGKANTTHTHTTSQLTDFTEATQDVIGSSLVAGTNVTLAYDDPSGITTISATPGAGVTDLSITTTANDVTVVSSTGNDAILSAATTTNAGVLSAVDKTKLGGIANGATANSSDATLLSRANHTGTQVIATVTNLQTTLDDKATTAALTSGLAGKANTSHNHNAADINNGTIDIARQPVGSVFYSSTIARPTNRTDVCVIFTTSADPGSAALDGDLWIRPS